MSVNTLRKRKLSIGAQGLAALCALIAAVALPQLLHVMGTLSGLGTALGEIFLPMHLPIILVGLLAGPLAGSLSGALAPLVSFALTGMPLTTMLPFIMIELATYGLCAGLLRNRKLPTAVKVVLVQLGGRALRTIAILLAVLAFGHGVALATIWTSIARGLIGLALQWTLIPLILYRFDHAGL